MFIDFGGADVAFRAIESGLCPHFSEAETVALVGALWSGAFDGSAVRLEGVQVGDGQVGLMLSETSFYQLLVSNLLVGRPVDSLLKVGDVALRVKALSVAAEKVAAEDVLGTPWLANALAVSVLIRDSRGDFLLVRRGAALAVGAGLWGVSVSGGLEAADLASENPVVNAVMREVKEELGLSIDPGAVLVEGLFIGDKKLQPVMLCTVALDEPLGSLLPLQGVDSDLEIASQVLVAKGDLKKYAERKRMSEAARFQINTHAK
jgi:8-oxo-dGTP pyrophosphatase MutT (NUDIX family)